MLEEPALHRRTFNELSAEERQQFLNELRDKRETIERQVKRIRSELVRHNVGSPIRKLYEKQCAKIDKLHAKWDALTTQLESLLNEMGSFE